MKGGPRTGRGPLSFGQVALLVDIQRMALERRTEGALELVKHLNVVLSHESERCPGSSHPGGASHPVHVRLDVFRHVEVDDVRDLRQIESPRRYVRGDENRW